MGLNGGGSGTRAVRRRCIMLAKISIRGGGDGSEAGTFFSALTFRIFRDQKKRGRKKRWKKKEEDIIYFVPKRMGMGGDGEGNS